MTLGVKYPVEREGKLVSFLYSGKSQSQTVWVCRMYLNLLRDGRKGEVWKERAPGDKLFLFSLSLTFAFALYKEKEIRNYLFPC